ncbi:MAG: CDP-archaeol synthase [Candidatus Hodarchaeales archaeon]|jgi:CDP-2,3-bis-(O-geranylgeranyl)-sn-glycerol synthase
MADEGQLILDIIIFVLPLWFGNAAPTILGGGPPIDGGRYWRDGKRILGDGKTIRGFWMAVLVGVVIGISLAFIISEIGGSIFDNPPLQLRLEYLNYYEHSILKDIASILNMSSIFEDPIMLGGLSGGIMSLGGMTGDMVGSFIKRRSGIPRGKTFIFLDQLGFLVLGMVFVFPIIPWPISWLAFLVPITFLTHIAANLFGYFTGIQDDPL